MGTTQPRTTSAAALGTGLFGVGSVGVGVMHAYLHSPWQIALFVLFAVVGLVGVGLTWHGGRRVNERSETAG